MAALHPQLRQDHWGRIPFRLCPQGISSPEALYQHTVPITQDGFTRPGRCKGRYSYSRRYNMNFFHWGDNTLRVMAGISDKIIRMLYLNTFIPPGSNAHSYRFFTPAPRDIVVDAGAFEGFYTWHALNCGAQVMAFEPLPPAQDMLALNFGDRIALFPALGAHDGATTLHSNREGSALHGAMDGHGGQIEVEVRTLDSVMNGGRVDLIKMDIEGSELDALRGASTTIKTFKPKLMVETYHRYRDAFDIYRFLLSLRPDYNILLWGNWVGNLIRKEVSTPVKPYTLVAW